MPLPPPLDRLFRAGDGAEREEAWAAFVEEYSRLLMSVTRSVARDVDGRMDGYAYLLDRLQADDFARLRGYAADGRARFSTWLVVVAQRLCIDFHRSRYGRTREAQDPAERAARRQLHDLVGDVIDIEALPGRTSSPDLGVRRAELTAALAMALGHLDPSDRLLLTLRFTDDLPASRIAQVMSYPTQFHVYRKLNRILARLKEELRDRESRIPPHEAEVRRRNRAARVRSTFAVTLQRPVPVTHLDPAIIAAYVERVISGDERARVDTHLAECDECRREVVAVSDLVRRARKPAWRSPRVIIPLAAAAGLLFVLSPWRVSRDIEPAHREPAVIASQPPTVRAPMGPVGKAPSVIWSEVRGANRYRVTLYDSTGRVLWEAATTDTVVALPGALALQPGARYFWRVHARTGFDRWTESNLVEFRIMDRR